MGKRKKILRSSIWFDLIWFFFIYRWSCRVYSVMKSWFWTGGNEFGQLGDGTENHRKHPKKVKQLQTECVKSVSCGAHCTAAIAEPRDNDGTISTRRLWVWGQNQVILVIRLVHILLLIYGIGMSLVFFSFSRVYRDPIIRVYIGEPLLQIR